MSYQDTLGEKQLRYFFQIASVAHLGTSQQLFKEQGKIGLILEVKTERIWTYGHRDGH